METYGWDTVFATTVEHINAALAKGTKQLVTEFSFELEGYRMEGCFGAWQVVPGGAGKLLHVRLPIARGTLTDPREKTADLAGVSVVVEIALQLLPASPSQPLHNVLRFDLRGDSDAKGVTTVGVDAPVGRLDSVQQAMLKQAVPMCLTANAAAITFVLSSVDMVQPGSGSPLAPVQSSFYYAELDDKRAFFSMLSVSDARSIAKLDHKIDPALLSTTETGFYAMAPDLLMRAVVQPMLPKLFPGTTAAMFKYNPDARSVQNTATFPMPSVHSGALDYVPIVNSLLLTSFNDGIACSVTGSCDMGLGIQCTFGVHAQNKLVFDGKTRALSFARDANPTVTHDFSIPWYDYLIPGILGIGDGILALVVDLVANGIADGLQRASADFSLARDTPQSVHWAGMESFQVESAGMANAFFMRGKLV